MIEDRCLQALRAGSSTISQPLAALFWEESLPWSQWDVMGQSHQDSYGGGAADALDLDLGLDLIRRRLAYDCAAGLVLAGPRFSLLNSFFEL